MARPLRIQYSGAFYHITCRGNERRKIFHDDDDRSRFIQLLAESLEIYRVVIYAYVLMDNHFHLVAQTLRSNLSEFMRRFNICYTGWFNYHHHTCGHLYQGRYKALLVDADNYLLELSRYVHLNPVRGRKLKRRGCHDQWRHAKSYPWSSLRGYLNAKCTEDFIEYNTILDMVGGRRAYRSFIDDSIKHGFDDIFEDVQYQTILGDDNFVAAVKNKYLEKGSLREQPDYRTMLSKIIAPDVVVACCADVLDVNEEELLARSGDGIIRGIVADMLYKYSGINQRAIGEILSSIGYTGVNMLRCRLQKKKNDPKIKENYDRVEKRLHEIYEL
ncbi:MAG: transposase [bacterium]